MLRPDETELDSRLAESVLTTGIPEAGTVLAGKFRVLRLLGKGGMGAVLEAVNTVTHKRVAIKWMHPEMAAHEEGAKRLMQEAQASARFSHPNVVDVYDIVREGESLFIVMELLDGEPLTAVLKRGDMPLHALLDLLVHAMRGVAAAHRHGVIHRDIKPDNIFLARETDRAVAVPKVLDFGISKVKDGENLGLTRTGVTMGSPMYMSYEQLCNSKDIDGRADVYSFGVILYEAITGTPPFSAETFPELAIKIATTEPTSPKRLRPETPTALERVVQGAMEKSRDRRIPSMEALIRELEPFTSESGFRGQMTVAQPAPPKVTPLPQSAPQVVPQSVATQREPEPKNVDTLGRLSSPAAGSQIELTALPTAWPHLRLAVGAAVALALALGVGVWMSASKPAAPVASQPLPPPPALPSVTSPPKAEEPAPVTPPQAQRPIDKVADSVAEPARGEHRESTRRAKSTPLQPIAPAPVEAVVSRPVQEPAAVVAPPPPAPAPSVEPAAAEKSPSEQGYRAGKPRRSDF